MIEVNRIRFKAKLVASEDISFDYDETNHKITIIGTELAVLRICYAFREEQIYYGKTNDGKFYFELELT